MIKATPGHIGRNNLRRSKNYTYEEWRIVFRPMFDKVKTDIFKNLKRLVSPDDDLDICQHLECEFYRYYSDFKCGDDRYEFPPTGGAFYQRNFLQIRDQFMYTCPNREVHVISRAHDVMVYMRDKDSVLTFEEESSDREHAARDTNMCTYLENHLGITIDGELGPEFSFWWMGYEYNEISAMLQVGGAKLSFKTIQRRMAKAFRLIETRYQIPRKEIKRIRKACMELSTLKEGRDNG